VGWSDGYKCRLGAPVGSCVGYGTPGPLGALVDGYKCRLGAPVGSWVGYGTPSALGALVASAIISALGTLVGCSRNELVMISVGTAVGMLVRATVIASVGTSVGSLSCTACILVRVGTEVGTNVGESVEILD